MISRSVEKDKAMYNFLIDYHQSDEKYLCTHGMTYNINSGKYALNGTPYSYMVLTPEEAEQEAKVAVLENIYKCSNEFIADHAYYCPPDSDDPDAYGHMISAIAHIKSMGVDMGTYTVNKILAELLDMDAFLDDLTWHGRDYRAAFDTYAQHCYEEYIIMEFRD